MVLAAVAGLAGALRATGQSPSPPPPGWSAEDWAKLPPGKQAVEAAAFGDTAGDDPDSKLAEIATNPEPGPEPQHVRDYEDELAAGDGTEEGLIEEGGYPAVKHVELLLDFGEACGKSRADIKNAQLNGELMSGTLGLQSWCAVQAAKPTHQAIAGLLVGLESQVPQIYKRTTPPLVEKYGFTEKEITFFRLHIVADTEHGKRGYDLVERLADTDAKKEACLRSVREATQMRRLYLDSLYNEFVAPRRAAAE